MKFSVMVNEGPYTHQAADTAYHFIDAALKAGHERSFACFSITMALITARA